MENLQIASLEGFHWDKSTPSLYIRGSCPVEVFNTQWTKSIYLTFFLSFISSSSNPLAGPSLLSTRFASVLSDLANSRTPPPCVSRLPWRCLQVSRAKNKHLISLVDLLVRIDVEIFLHCVCDLERCSLYRYDQNQGQYLLVYGHLILFVVKNINIIFHIDTILYVQALVL